MPDTYLKTVIDLLLCALDGLLLLYYSTLFFNFKPTVKNRIIVLTILFTFGSFFLSWLPADRSVASILSLLIAVAFCRCLFKGSLFRIVLSTISLYVSSGLITLAANSSVFFFTDTASETLMSTPSSLIIMGLAVKGITLLLIVMVRKSLKKNDLKEELLSSKVLFIYLFLCFFALIVLFELIISSSIIEQSTNILLLGTYIVSFFIIILLFDRMYRFKSESDLFKHDVLRYKIKEQERFQQVENDIETLKLKHDLKNHLVSLRSLLEANRIEQAKRYLDEFSLQPVIKEYASTNNPTINALFNMKINQYPDIRFSIRADIDLFPIKNEDLTILLGNALDNAIEANLRNQSEEKQISVTLHEGTQFCRVMIVNRFCGQIDIRDKTIYSSKNPGCIGMGLFNMEEIAKKYHGKLKYTIQGNVFKLVVILEKS